MVLLPFLFSNYVVAEESLNHIRIGEFYLENIAKDNDCVKFETTSMIGFSYDGEGDIDSFDTICDVISNVNLYNMYGDRDFITPKTRNIFIKTAYLYSEHIGDSIENDFELFDKHNIK
ncbi:hypothetical protein KY334_02510 [Candidatus Woesearchaeota archaeon]|nr:hypothetical protein [Candidatus Woesearchaeota archaeon]